MITAYCADGLSVKVSPADAFPSNAVWVDMIEPTRDEELYVERNLAVQSPTCEDPKGIEPSARLYVEQDAVFMTASMVSRSYSQVPVLADVGFVLSGRSLVTIRYTPLQSFTIASVVFLPLALVAYIYGMNFEFMPELHRSGGYPASIALMAVSVLLPFFSSAGKAGSKGA